LIKIVKSLIGIESSIISLNVIAKKYNISHKYLTVKFARCVYKLTLKTATLIPFYVTFFPPPPYSPFATAND